MGITKNGKHYKNLYDYYTDWKNCESAEQAYKRLEMLSMHGIIEKKDWTINKSRR